MTKDERISAETERLLKIYKDIEPDKLGVCRQLIQNAAYIAASLQDLQKDIDKNGMIEGYDNGGNQTGRHISPAAQQYTKLVATYNQIIRQLVGLLPAGGREAARIQSDPMADYLGSK